MLCRFLSLLTLVFFGLGLLTTVAAPSWVSWQLTVLAGSFGHWLALGALALAAAAWRVRRDSRIGALIAVAAGVGGAVLLARPAVLAAKWNRSLPGTLSKRLGADYRPDREAFSPAGLIPRNGERVAVQTMEFAPGLALDFYRAAHIAPSPCVILIHGGGWDNGSRDELPALNHHLATRGYAVAAISYRLTPKYRWPAQRDDVLAALAYLKSHAPELNIDPQRFVLLGRSAGGQIAEATAYTMSDPAVRGVIALYAPADLEFAYRYGSEDDILKSPLLIRQLLGGAPSELPDLSWSAGGYFHVNAATPPTLLIHGELDTLVWHRQSERLAARLDQAGVRNVFLSLPWASHALEYRLESPAGQLATYAIEWFLASVTAPDHVALRLNLPRARQKQPAPGKITG